MVHLNGTSPYAAKDQRKADVATKFIGRGSPTSSTAKYARAFGALANCGTYSASDAVFISAEGARRGRESIDRDEIKRAADAGVTFITDNRYDRERSYNVGEREVAALLVTLGYPLSNNGTWVK